MTPPLADSGALVSYLAPEQKAHAKLIAYMATLPTGVTTTSSAFTEAMHLLGRIARYRGQQALWTMRRRGLLDVAVPDWDRSEELMHQYRDVPMDLADATLVALAEARDQRTILTIDGDFLIYRAKKGHRHVPFRVFPKP